MLSKPRKTLFHKSVIILHCMIHKVTALSIWERFDPFLLKIKSQYKDDMSESNSSLVCLQRHKTFMSLTLHHCFTSQSNFGKIYIDIYMCINNLLRNE